MNYLFHTNCEGNLFLNLTEMIDVFATYGITSRGPNFVITNAAIKKKVGKIEPAFYCLRCKKGVDFSEISARCMNCGKDYHFSKMFLSTSSGGTYCKDCITNKLKENGIKLSDIKNISL